MSYHTPELLLVGAAQSLVLGVDPKNVSPINFDGEDAYDTTSPEVDDSNW